MRETPFEIRDASARNFEVVLRLYYLRHGFDHCDPYLGRCLAQLAFLTLQRMASCPPPNPSELASLRATVVLAAKGLYDQGQNYFVDKAMLCTVQAKMGPDERQLLGQVVADAEIVAPSVAAQMRHVRSRVLPSAISFRDDPEVHRLGRLVEELKLGGQSSVEDEGEEVVVVEEEELVD